MRLGFCLFEKFDVGCLVISYLFMENSFQTRYDADYSITIYQPTHPNPSLGKRGVGVSSSKRFWIRHFSKNLRYPIYKIWIHLIIPRGIQLIHQSPKQKAIVNFSIGKLKAKCSMFDVWCLKSDVVGNPLNTGILTNRLPEYRPTDYQFTDH